VGLQRDQKLLMDIILAKTNLKEEDLKKMFLEAHTKTPQEAKALGIIHDVKEAKIPAGTQIASFVFQQRPWR